MWPRYSGTRRGSSLTSLPPDLRMSYRYCFCDHAVAEFHRQCLGSQHIDRDAKEFLQLVLYPGDVQQRGIRCGINQEIEVTILGVLASQHGSEHARVARAILRDDAADLVAVDTKGFGRSHEPLTPSRKRSKRQRDLTPISSSLALELLRCRDKLVELRPRRAARDRLARVVDPGLNALGMAGDIDRGPGVDEHDVERRTGLILEHRQDHVPRFLHGIDLDRAPVVQLQAELRGMDLVLADFALQQLADRPRAGDRNL